MSRFALRVPDHILAQAKAAAAEDNVSIIHLLVALISEGLGHPPAWTASCESARRGPIRPKPCASSTVPPTSRPTNVIECRSCRRDRPSERAETGTRAAAAGGPTVQLHLVTVGGNVQGFRT